MSTRATNARAVCIYRYEHPRSRHPTKSDILKYFLGLSRLLWLPKSAVACCWVVYSYVMVEAPCAAPHPESRGAAAQRGHSASLLAGLSKDANPHSSGGPRAFRSRFSRILTAGRHRNGAKSWGGSGCPTCQHRWNRVVPRVACQPHFLAIESNSYLQSV